MYRLTGKGHFLLAEIGLWLSRNWLKIGNEEVITGLTQQQICLTYPIHLFYLD